MKDWKRSPEPPSMMGIHAGSTSAGDWPATVHPGDDAAPPQTDQNDVGPMVRPRTKALASLAELAKKVILQKIHLFDTFGNTPFPIVKPILEQCSAKKLWALEEESPHLRVHTGYIWKRLCIKEFRDISHAYNEGTLEEAEDWRLLFESKQSAQQEVLEAAAARVKEKYASLAANRVAHRMRVVAGTPALQTKPSRGKRVPPSTLTTGQKLLSKARKQGSARMQMTTGMRKAAAPAPLSTPPSKRARIAEEPPCSPLSAQSTARNQALQAQRNPQSPPSGRPNGIFITKRRIPLNGPANTQRY